MRWRSEMEVHGIDATHGTAITADQLGWCQGGGQCRHIFHTWSVWVWQSRMLIQMVGFYGVVLVLVGGIPTRS